MSYDEILRLLFYFFSKEILGLLKHVCMPNLNHARILLPWTWKFSNSQHIKMLPLWLLIDTKSLGWSFQANSMYVKLQLEYKRFGLSCFDQSSKLTKQFTLDWMAK